MVPATEWLSSPLSRDAEHSGKQSVGLGLYIASVIARAYGGALTWLDTGRDGVCVQDGVG